jgi:hypothetical protein
MARCPHCGEAMADGQEHCYACGQHHRTRGAYRHEHRVNPLVYVATGLVVVLVLGSLLLMRANAARKQAALLAEQELLRVQDSTRRASHQWQSMVQFAKEDEEAQSLYAQLDDIQSRFESIRTRVASHPSPQQESIINRVESGLDSLRTSVVLLANAAEDEKPALRDSFQLGTQRLENLAKELGSSE